MIALNRRRYMGGGSGLPYDAEVEYVETTSNSKTSTSIFISDVGFVRVVKQYTVQYNASAGDGVSIPAQGSRARCFCNIGLIRNPDGIGFQWSGVSSSQKKVIDFDTNEHTFEIDVVNKTCTIDLTTVTLIVSDTSVYNDVYFYISGYGNSLLGIRYKSLEIYNMNMEKVLDLIPIRVSQQGGFYDKISNMLIGVGSFTAGPDKTI